MKKPYEIQLSKDEYNRFRKLMILVERIMNVYDEHPDLEIIIKVKPKKWWHLKR